jgi:DNA-binding transcriptional ArsR family regulator
VVTYQDRQLDAIGDPTRRAILDRLREGPQAVGELAKGFPISRPAISQHLRVLREAGFVVDEALGNRRFYRLHPRGFAALRTYLDAFWAVALNAFQDHVDQERTEP